MALRITVTEPADRPLPGLDADAGSQAAGIPVGRVLLLPGANYPAQMPGLVLPSTVLRERGWRVASAAWEPFEWGEQAVEFMEAAIEQLDEYAGDAPATLVVAKSVSTLCAGWAARRQVPGVWLTPMLNRRRVREGLLGCPRSLLVGGTADPMWVLDDELRARHEVLELPGLDHGMFVPGDWRATLAALEAVLAAVEWFAAGLGG